VREHGTGHERVGVKSLPSVSWQGRRKLSNFHQLLLKPMSYSAFLVVNVFGVIVTGEKNKISKDKGVRWVQSKHVSSMSISLYLSST
jgi:hypothetical protein